MMSRFVTLAISETRPREFKIILYDLDNQLFQEKEMKYEAFFDDQNQAIWDLFHVTEWNGSKWILKGRLEKKKDA